MANNDPQKERKTTLQSNLDHLLKRDRLSMEAASLKAGLSRGSVLRIQSNEDPNPRIHTIQALADLFNVTRGQLLDVDLSADANQTAPAQSALGLNYEAMKAAIVDVITAAKRNDFPIELESTLPNSVTPDDIADAAVFVCLETQNQAHNADTDPDTRSQMIDTADNVLRFRVQSKG